MRHLSEIIVHCSATHANWAHDKSLEWKVGEIRRWHVSPPNGWRDIGYHYVIDRDGKIMAGRPLDQTGAHVRGRNTGTVGICLLGGHGSSSTDSFNDHFTRTQEKTLRLEIAKLRTAYPSIKKVSGHNEYAPKACPGFHVPTWYAASNFTRPDVEPTPPVKPWWAKIAELFR